MDRDRLVEVAPHYVAMLALTYLVLIIAGSTVGDLGFWTELAVIAVVVFAYRPAVMRLGIGPTAWERQ